jgi:hypothetical protein
MEHPKDHEVYPVGTVVREIKTGVFWMIIKPVFLMDGKGFLHYLARKEGYEYKEGQYHALYHEGVELEALPPNDQNSR